MHIWVIFSIFLLLVHFAPISFISHHQVYWWFLFYLCIYTDFLIFILFWWWLLAAPSLLSLWLITIFLPLPEGTSYLKPLCFLSLFNKRSGSWIASLLFACPLPVLWKNRCFSSDFVYDTCPSSKEQISTAPSTESKPACFCGSFHTLHLWHCDV